MQTANANQNFSSDDPAWVLLAKLLLSDFMPYQDWRDEPAARYLFQTLRELGMAPEGMENIARTLAGFIEEALTRIKQGRLEFAGRIRVFCQKKIIDGANSAKTLRPPESGEKQKQTSPDSRAKTIDGWGYFMIERGEDFPPDSSSFSYNYVDLYLYKEGE